jgi:uncharacterized membrane protein YkoI
MLRTLIPVCLAVALYAQGAIADEAQLPGQAADTSAPAAPLADANSRDRIVAALERRYNAKVVRIIDVTVGGRLAYDIRLLSKDRVWTVRIDAESGRELARED